MVIGLPLHDEQEHLVQALESLLAQSYDELAIVIVDDCSTDASPEIAAGYAARDPRVLLERSSTRLGLTAAWREVYRLGMERYPNAEYFAWGSGHDVWHPRWLSALVPVLDANSEVVLAYPLSVAVSGDGAMTRSPWRFDTRGLASPRARLRAALGGMIAGDMVYGLMRTRELPRAGVFRDVLWPDRLLLAELTALGEFSQVPELLWYRRYNNPASARSQRRASFPAGAPVHSQLPWWLEHAGVLACWHLCAGRGSRCGREPRRAARAGLAFAASYLALSAPREMLRRVLRWRNRLAGWAVREVPGARRLLASTERAVRARGREVKLLPSQPVDFDSLAMINRHSSRSLRIGTR